MEWDAFGDQLDNTFFFVVDKIVAILNFFSAQAKNIGSLVLLIAILTAALNYALTGQGLKENIIKITKATLFFLIAMVAYPRIIGWISTYTFSLAEGSMGPAVRAHFNSSITDTIVKQSHPGGSSFEELSRQMPDRDALSLLGGLSTTREARTGFGPGSGTLTYKAFAPAALAKIMFLVSSECFKYTDKQSIGLDIGQMFSRAIKGLLCAFFIILTGAFALLEYVVCFLEFMLVACVGVILFPLSIWEGSKFLSEKFIGAIVGFFMKLLLCSIAIFLMLYGYISLLAIINKTGFTATPDQIIFIIITCLLFLFICKSAPGIAQSLLTGTPSLSAAGAISAASGALAAAGAVHGAMGKAAGTAEKAIVGGAASVAKAGAAAAAAKTQGGKPAAVGAFFKSLGGDAALSARDGGIGLTRSLLGMKEGIAGSKSQAEVNKEMTLGDRFTASREKGAASVKQRGIVHSKSGAPRQGASVADDPNYKGPGASGGGATADGGGGSSGSGGE